MYGGFLQSLYISKNHPYRKIFLSFVILIIPMVIADVIATQQTFFSDQNNFAADANKFGIVFFLYPLSILIYFIAIKIIVKAMEDKNCEQVKNQVYNSAKLIKALLFIDIIGLMSKKRIIFSLILGAIVMGIVPLLGLMLVARLLFPHGTLPNVISLLLIFSFFIPGGLVSGFLIKKKGWLMGGLTSCIFIAGIIIIALIQNNLRLPDNMPSHYVPPQPVNLVAIWQDFLYKISYALGILTAGILGGFLGEIIGKKK